MLGFHFEIGRIKEMSWPPPTQKKSAVHNFDILFETGGRLQQDGLLWVFLHIIKDISSSTSHEKLSLQEFRKFCRFRDNLRNRGFVIFFFYYILMDNFCPCFLNKIVLIYVI